MSNKNLFIVILAGGAGTRLWPISRQANPKQFVEIGNGKSLLEQAIDRASAIVDSKNIWISTTSEHEKKVQEYFGHKIGKIVIEPCARNTAPAILLSCLQIYEQDPHSSIVILPADPFIPDQEKFVNYLQQAIDFIKTNNKITLIGVKPTYPATGYGYIEYKPSKTKKILSQNTEQETYTEELEIKTNKLSGSPIFQEDFKEPESITCYAHKVTKFHEKPDQETAKEYLKHTNIIWNIGTFCAKAHVFIKEFETHAPEIFACVSNYVNGIYSYSMAKADSIDYAIIEKSKNIFVVPADMQWYDVGNIEVFLNIQKEYTQLDENIISVNSKNNLVRVKNKLVALVGIQDLCLVETDDILLVTRRDNAEQVKEIVKLLREKNNTDYL